MNAKAAAGVLVGLAFLVLFVFAILPAALVWPAGAPALTGVGTAMWLDRTFEVLLQAIILLGGVVAILLLLGSRRSREASP